MVQPGPELVQPGPEVVQVGPLLVHSNISSTGNGTDDWNHLTTECKFYETKFDSKWSTERELAEYVVKVSQERYRRVKLPLL